MKTTFELEAFMTEFMKHAPTAAAIKENCAHVIAPLNCAPDKPITTAGVEEAAKQLTLASFGTINEVLKEASVRTAS